MFVAPGTATPLRSQAYVAVASAGRASTMARSMATTPDSAAPNVAIAASGMSPASYSARISASARQLADDLRAGNPVTPTRGPGRLVTWREAARILAGFNDDQATQGPAAGPADLVGLKIAKEHGWTAPEPGSAGNHGAGNHGAGNQGAGDHAKESR